VLPTGVFVHQLATHADERGAFTELFRDEWETGVRPVQWNAVASAAGVLRGVHVHVRHGDYLTVVAGRAHVGLRDLRDDSPTSGLAAMVELRADAMAAIVIPPGVAHGFLFSEPSLHVYAVTHYWDADDELGCHWADPELGLEWPQRPRLLSGRDELAGTLAALRARLAPHQPALARPSRIA
jgi:dTDP-4-dehydrorhamnose 3,5-epimerase